MMSLENKPMCDDLHERLAFSQGQLAFNQGLLSAAMHRMQTLQNENSTLQQQIASLLKEKQSFEVEKKKSYKLGFSVGQKIQSQQKTDEKVSKEETLPNVVASTSVVVKAKEEVKITRNLRWSEYPSDDEASVDLSVKLKNLKPKKPNKTIAEKLLKDSLLIKVNEISHDYNLIEAEFLAFLDLNTEGGKLPGEMIMNFAKGENIFRISGCAFFYTPEALVTENAKRALENRHLLIEPAFNFAEIFNQRNENYELILKGIPNEAKIKRLVKVSCN